jgi:hypothetical protein
LSLLQALLGFVALNPTYFLPVLLRIAKPNNADFGTEPKKFLFRSDWTLAAPLV